MILICSFVEQEVEHTLWMSNILEMKNETRNVNGESSSLSLSLSGVYICRTCIFAPWLLFVGSLMMLQSCIWNFGFYSSTAVKSYSNLDTFCLPLLFAFRFLKWTPIDTMDILCLILGVPTVPVMRLPDSDRLIYLRFFFLNRCTLEMLASQLSHILQIYPGYIHTCRTVIHLIE